MHRSVLIMLIVITFLWFVNEDCMAKKINENAGTKGGQILKIGVGANAVGMGESYVAAADDIYSVYWNPAGLHKIDRSQLGFMHNEWFEDIRHEFIGYVQPVGSMGTLAGSISYVSMGELDKTDESGKELGKFHPYDILFGLSYGTGIGKSAAFGLSVKLLQEKIDEEKAQAIAFDVAGLYDLSGKGFIIGINLQNLGTRMKFVEESFQIPLNLKIGIAQRLINNALTFAADVNFPSDNDINMGLGIEYRIMGMIDLRAGYRYTLGGNDLGAFSGFRTGIGLGFGRYRIDYALVPYGELGQAHRISLIASF
ncbi:MAG: PorV/PorQ family protein [bacterium]